MTEEGLLTLLRLSWSVGSGLALASAQHDGAVHVAAWKKLFGGAAVRPTDGDGVDVMRWTQTEMGVRRVAAQIALAGINESNPALTTRLDRDGRAIGVAPPGRIEGADKQPMPLFGRHIAIQPRR